MKRFFIFGFFGILLILGSAAYADGNQKNELKVLLIGNSFTQSLARYFPDAVESVPGCTLDLEFMTIGGASFKQHWDNIEREEADPDFKYFKTHSYKEKLQSKKWNVVSLHPGIADAWTNDDHMQYIVKLMKYVKKYAPQAEIVIQQTWSYRPDDPDMKKWGITQQQMYDQLFPVYNRAAETLNIRLIPTGAAVQLVRETQPHKYVHFNPADYKYPELPDMTGSLIGTIGWSGDHSRLEGDTIHLNRRGEYLQACVWFGVLYNRDPREITLQPKEITKEDAEFLREAAWKTISTYKQVKK